MWEARSNDIDLAHSISWQEQLIAAADRVVLISEAERTAYATLGYLEINSAVSVVHNGYQPGYVPVAPRGRYDRVLRAAGAAQAARIPADHPQ